MEIQQRKKPCCYLNRPIQPEFKGNHKHMHAREDREKRGKRVSIASALELHKELLGPSLDLTRVFANVSNSY